MAFNKTMSFETQRMSSETSVGRVVRSLEIQVAKATNRQKNGSAEESTLNKSLTVNVLQLPNL